MHGARLEVVDPRRFLADLESVRSQQPATAGHLSLSELFTPMRHEDPLFVRSAPVIEHLRALPEPFRSKLLARLVNSLPPDHFSNLERLDPELVRALRRSGRDSVDATPPEGIHPHPYMANVQYSSAFFTAEADPVRHTPRHDGRYFVMPAEEEAALLPEGLPGPVADEFGLTQRRALMVRAEVRGLVEELERFRLESRAWLLAGDGRADAAPRDPTFGGEVIARAAWRARHRPDGDSDGSDAEEEAEVPAASPELEAEVMALAAEAAGEAGPSAPPARVLTGVRGVGKSCALLQVVRYARAHGWVAVFVPSAYDLTHRGRVLTPTRGVPGDYDQNDLATEMLSHVLAAHGPQLAEAPQRGTYDLDLFLPADRDEEMRAEVARRVAEEEDEVASLKAEAEARGEAFDPSTDWSSRLRDDLARGDSLDRRKEGFTLKDMVEWGLAHPPQATRAAVALLEELRSVVEFPVLIAVDGVNDLFEPSGYPGPYGRRLSTRRLPLVRALQAFDGSGADPAKALRRGVFVGAASLARHKRPSLLRETPVGSAAKVPADNRLEIPPLTRSEVHSQLLHYTMTGRFPELPARAEVDAHAVEVYSALSSGIPLELRTAALLQM